MPPGAIDNASGASSRSFKDHRLPSAFSHRFVEACSPLLCLTGIDPDGAAYGRGGVVTVCGQFQQYAPPPLIGKVKDPLVDHQQGEAGVSLSRAMSFCP